MLVVRQEWQAPGQLLVPFKQFRTGTRRRGCLSLENGGVKVTTVVIRNPVTWVSTNSHIPTPPEIWSDRCKHKYKHLKVNINRE